MNISIINEIVELQLIYKIFNQSLIVIDKKILIKK